eukprot:scaffold194459_cov23-Tisochrysis_lutea.AAC.2
MNHVPFETRIQQQDPCLMHAPRDAHPWATGAVLGFCPWSLVITGDAHPATRSSLGFNLRSCTLAVVQVLQCIGWLSRQLRCAWSLIAGAHLSAALVAVVHVQLLADDFV